MCFLCFLHFFLSTALNCTDFKLLGPIVYALLLVPALVGIFADSNCIRHFYAKCRLKEVDFPRENNARHLDDVRYRSLL